MLITEVNNEKLTKILFYAERRLIKHINIISTSVTAALRVWPPRAHDARVHALPLHPHPTTSDSLKSLNM